MGDERLQPLLGDQIEERRRRHKIVAVKQRRVRQLRQIDLAAFDPALECGAAQDEARLIAGDDICAAQRPGRHPAWHVRKQLDIAIDDQPALRRRQSAAPGTGGWRPSRSPDRGLAQSRARPTGWSPRRPRTADLAAASTPAHGATANRR